LSLTQCSLYTKEPGSANQALPTNYRVELKMANFTSNVLEACP